MAKTSKVKKNPTANPRSRASKRATSPSINVDKSIKDAPRASDATPILSARPDGGITKSKRKQKPLSRGQRRRREKGLARAEMIQDQFARKIEDASHRLKKRRERKGMWEEVNGTNKFDKLKAILGDAAGQNEEDGWVDEDMEEIENDGGHIKDVQNVVTVSKTKLVVVVNRTGTAAPPAPMTTTQEEEDEADKIT